MHLKEMGWEGVEGINVTEDWESPGVFLNGRCFPAVLYFAVFFP
jgi:hypothetical protein